MTSPGAYVVVSGRGRDGGRFAEQLAELVAVAVAVTAVPLPVAVAITIVVVVAVLVAALAQVFNSLFNGGVADAAFQRTEAGVLAAQADELF